MTYKMTHVIIGFNKQNTEGGNDNTCIQIMLFNRGTLKNFDALSGFSFLISPKSFFNFFNELLQLSIKQKEEWRNIKTHSPVLLSVEFCWQFHYSFLFSSTPEPTFLSNRLHLFDPYQMLLQCAWEGGGGSIPK